jgi:hypothetical protein
MEDNSMNPEDRDLNGGILDEAQPNEETIINEETTVVHAKNQEDVTEQEDAQASSDIKDPIEPVGPASEKKPLPISTVVLSFLCVALAAVLLLTQFGVIDTLRKAPGAHSDWFNSPEESIRFFVENVRDNRFDMATAAFAGEEIDPEAQFALQLERVGSYSPLTQYNLPEQYPAYASSVLAISKGKSAISTLQFASSLLLGETYMQQKAFSTEVETAKAEITAIASQLDPEKLKGLTFIRADVIDATYQSSEEYTSFIGQRVAAYGYDTYTEYMALVKLDETFYIAMFAMVSDNGKWKIYEMNSGLLQFSYSIAVPITEEDYLKMI